MPEPYLSPTDPPFDEEAQAAREWDADAARTDGRIVNDAEPRITPAGRRKLDGLGIDPELVEYHPDDDADAARAAADPTRELAHWVDAVGQDVRLVLVGPDLGLFVNQDEWPEGAPVPVHLEPQVDVLLPALLDALEREMLGMVPRLLPYTVGYLSGQLRVARDTVATIVALLDDRGDPTNYDGGEPF